MKFAEHCILGLEPPYFAQERSVSFIFRLARRTVQFLVAAYPSGRTKSALIGAVLKHVQLPLSAFCRRGGIAVQCGCCHEQTLHDWIRIVGPGGRIIIVEADRANAVRLEAICEAHGYSNVCVICNALWRENEAITFQVSSVPDFNRVKEAQTWSDKLPDSVYEEEVTVEGARLDDILRALDVSHADHIHMTISGGELDALEGMTEILTQSNTTVFVRSLCLHNDDGKPTNGRVAEFLRGRGFCSILAAQESNKYGGNVFAWKQRAA